MRILKFTFAVFFLSFTFISFAQEKPYLIIEDNDGQYDVDNADVTVREGDRTQYSYTLNRSSYALNLSTEIDLKRWNVVLSTLASYTESFRNGDFRSGYYRDQTFALATGMVTIEQLLGQLYANPTLEADPHSAGRQMNNHFATRNLYPDGTWKALKLQKNAAADNSPTASQMTRALGLAMASKKYRELNSQIGENKFSNKCNENVPKMHPVSVCG